MNRERLLKLAAFLETMPVAKFDYRVMMEPYGLAPLEALAAGEIYCGTVGCAMGWTPAVFPELVRWDDAWYDVVSLDGRCRSWSAIQELFDITHEDALFLFMPHGAEKRGNKLNSRTLPYQVGTHIRCFVADPSYTP